MFRHRCKVLPNTPTRCLVVTSSGPCHGMLEGGYNLGELCLAHPKSSQCTPPCCWLLKKLPLQKVSSAPQGLVTKCCVWRAKKLETRHELEIYHQTVTASAEKPIPRRAVGLVGLMVAVAAGEPSNHREIRGNHFTQGARCRETLNETWWDHSWTPKTLATRLGGPQNKAPTGKGCVFPPVIHQFSSIHGW